MLNQGLNSFCLFKDAVENRLNRIPRYVVSMTSPPVLLSNLSWIRRRLVSLPPTFLAFYPLSP